jgi:uncharacterized FlgJ-related protein
LDEANKIFDQLRINGINEALAGFIVAQAAHETNGFTSFIYLANKNAFGMKYAKQAAAAGEKNGYAYYSTIQMSVLDFVIWFGKRTKSFINLINPIKTLEGFVKFLKNNDYFEASETEYLNGCVYWYNKLFA